MKKLFGAVVVSGVLLLAGCSEVSTSVDNQNKVQQEKMLEEANRQTGLPNISNFFEKKMLKKVLELRDNPQLTTYAYTQNMDGKLVYLGRCIGYGIPYDTQYTNPDKRIGDGIDGEIATIPQADPNGLFSGSGTSATWLMLVNEETNEPEIVYAEPNMLVTQNKMPKRLVEAWSLPKNY
jgi:hypothetical protein